MGRTRQTSPARNDLTATRFSRHRLSGALLILLAPAWANCGGDKPSPLSTGPTPTITPSASVTRVAISGNLALSAIGQTSQLTATATLTDNTTKDVTGAGQWDYGDSRVISVNSTGLVTVAGFGATWVSFIYQSRGAGETVTATPSGTYAIGGRVREPGAGGLLDVRVVETQSGRSATTDSDGAFSLAELPTRQAHLKAAKDGYEPAEVDAGQQSVDLPLQKVVRLTAGETVTPGALAPNDLSYTVGGTRCYPCRLIRVVVPQAATVHVRVTWTPAGAILNLFAEGQIVRGQSGELIADVPINAPREVLMYLGASSVLTGHTPFTFETSVR